MARVVVATRVGGIPEAITPETGRLVTPGNLTELAEAISYVLEDEERARQMGQAGRKRVLEHFSQKKYITEIEKIMAEVLTAYPSRLDLRAASETTKL